MRFVFEQFGKEVTVISGDSKIPPEFMHFPGVSDIIGKDFFEVDLSKFDLFIVLDSASLGMISRYGQINFPDSLSVVDIDHHISNDGYGNINLIEPEYPATCQILFDLFKEWGIKMNSDIAQNLFIGIYTDTLFKYDGVTAHTFDIAANLARYIPSISKLIALMENSDTPKNISFQGFALNSIDTFLEGRLAISSVPQSFFIEKDIKDSDISPSDISSIMRSVAEWKISVSLIETEVNIIKVSIRSQDVGKYDVSRLATALGGGGHRAASGAVLNMTLDDAKKLVVLKVKELYNL